MAPVIWFAASLWRKYLWRTEFIGITGSLGKTTAKELAAACLESRWPTMKTARNANGDAQIARQILNIRGRHRRAVLEVGLGKTGSLARIAHLVRPRIAAVTCIAMEHRSTWGTLEGIVQAKQPLLDEVAPGGTVWLNGDDPWVMTMRVPAGATCKRFGTSPEFELWSDQIESAWPQRLCFTAHSGAEQVRVTTQLAGAHWLPSVLAALGVAIECGMSLTESAAAIAAVAPFPGRMQAVALSNGTTMIRDEGKAGIDTFAPALRLLAQAPAGRRWIVAGECAEVSWGPKVRMQRLGRDVAAAADFAVFVGEHASAAQSRAVRAGMAEEHVFGATSAREAAQILRRETRPGDLILLKGHIRLHLSRIYFALEQERFGPVSCWVDNCRLLIVCDHCPELHRKEKPR